MGVLEIEAGEFSGRRAKAQYAPERTREVFAARGNVTSPLSSGFPTR